MLEFLITLPVELILFALVLVVARQFSSVERPWLWLSFVAHQLSVAGLIYINQSYYGNGDMLGYQRWGIEAAALLRDDFFDLAPALGGLVMQNADPLQIPLKVIRGNTGSMQGISAFAMFFFGDSLWASCAAIGGAAFFAKLAVYVAARAELPEVSRRALLVGCLMVPSAVFWSSGLLKEPFAVLGLYTAVYAWHKLLSGGNKLISLALLGASATLMTLLKGYILPVFGCGAAIWYLLRAINARSGAIVIKTGHVVVAVAVAVVAVLGTGAMLPEFSIDTLDQELANLQITGARLERGGNYSLGQAAGTTGGQIFLVPVGLLTALFRPALFDINSPLAFLNAVEMTGFTVLFGILIFRRRWKESVATLLRRPFLGFCFVFMLMFGTGVGVASTNLGSLSRYRIPMMPFMAVLLLTLTARRKKEEQREPALSAATPLLRAIAPPRSAEERAI